MKQNKNTLYNNQILKCLMTGDTFTTQQIADNVGLSEKTVRTRINQLNDWLNRDWDGSSESREQEYGWNWKRARKCSCQDGCRPAMISLLQPDSIIEINS